MITWKDTWAVAVIVAVSVGDHMLGNSLRTEGDAGWPRGTAPAAPGLKERQRRHISPLNNRSTFFNRTEVLIIFFVQAFISNPSGDELHLQGCAKERELSWEKVSARLQPATAGHARLVLSKTVPFFCTSLYYNIREQNILTKNVGCFKNHLGSSTLR